jgi:hypothetical protein
MAPPQNSVGLQSDLAVTAALWPNPQQHRENNNSSKPFPEKATAILI